MEKTVSIDLDCEAMTVLYDRVMQRIASHLEHSDGRGFEAMFESLNVTCKVQALIITGLAEMASKLGGYEAGVECARKTTLAYCRDIEARDLRRARRDRDEMTWVDLEPSGHA